MMGSLPSGTATLKVPEQLKGDPLLKRVFDQLENAHEHASTLPGPDGTKRRVRLNGTTLEVLTSTGWSAVGQVGGSAGGARSSSSTSTSEVGIGISLLIDNAALGVRRSLNLNAGTGIDLTVSDSSAASRTSVAIAADVGSGAGQLLDHTTHDLLDHTAIAAKPKLKVSIFDTDVVLTAADSGLIILAYGCTSVTLPDVSTAAGLPFAIVNAVGDPVSLLTADPDNQICDIAEFPPLCRIDLFSDGVMNWYAEGNFTLTGDTTPTNVAATSTGGSAGVAIALSREDHTHGIDAHTHADATHGGDLTLYSRKSTSSDQSFTVVNKGPVVRTPDNAHTYRLGVDNSGNVISTLVT